MSEKRTYTPEQTAFRREAARRYAEKYPERVAAARRRYRTSEKGREWRRGYRARNADRENGRTQAWREANPEKHKTYGVKWRKANPERVRKLNKTNKLRELGFTPEMYAAALELQDNKCAICEKVFAGLPTREVHADHDHMTGLARGVLCGSCNLGLGFFRDDVTRLRAAIQYLDSPTLKFFGHRV